MYQDDNENSRRKIAEIGMRIQQPKNSAPSNIQITAEQIIKEAQAHRTDELKIPIQRINDDDELDEYKLKKRRDFEDQIRRNRYNIQLWIKYAEWEEHQTEYIRARSIFERAIEIDYKNPTLWLKYAEMEMKNKFVNHARNVWERAVKYLPRIDQFWYKWAYMEELLGNYIGAREIFKTWMTWKPNYSAWKSFVRFEEKMGEYDNARNVMYDYLNNIHDLESFLKVAKYEEKHKNFLSARKIYEEGLTELGKDALCQEYFLAFINFELSHKEYDRCRALFKFGLENIEGDKDKLNDNYIKFEKKYGNSQKLEDMVINRRRIYYEKKIKENNMDYDIWFDYTKLEEEYGTENSCREIYERAISNVPLIKEKKYWRRYIYLWINYALYEECICNNIQVTEEIYKNVLDLIPHKEFTFSKIWILATNFYLRQKNLDKARKLFGISMGMCPKKKIIDAYINIELQLGNNDRVKKIFQSYIQKFPADENVWFNFCKFEETLGENNVAEVLYLNSIKFLRENKNVDGLYKMYNELINFYKSLKGKDKKENDKTKNKIKKTFDDMLKDKNIVKNIDKEKQIEIWNRYAELYSESKKYDEMDKIYKKCLEEIIGSVNKEELKIKYSEMIINNWTNHYKGDNKRLDKIKELLNYDEEDDEQENDNENEEESKEEYVEKNKNKSSLMEKALEWKEKNK